jgi:FKBP-type peptidyl-prolyl cis-trans isomerase FkpA
MIAGFDEAITYMSVGGKSQLIVPSSLGYGTQGYYTIAGYTPLLYDVELVKVVPGPGK